MFARAQRRQEGTVLREILLGLSEYMKMYWPHVRRRGSVYGDKKFQAGAVDEGMVVRTHKFFTTQWFKILDLASGLPLSDCLL